MVTAIVLLKVERERLGRVAETLRDITGVSEVCYVAGQWDLVAILRARDDDHFASIVTEGMLQVEGIKSSETLIAIQVLSRYDLGSVFASELG